MSRGSLFCSYRPHPVVAHDEGELIQTPNLHPGFRLNVKVFSWPLEAGLGLIGLGVMLPLIVPPEQLEPSPLHTPHLSFFALESKLPSHPTA